MVEDFAVVVGFGLFRVILFVLFRGSFSGGEQG